MVLTAVAVRAVHLLAVALLLGGAALLARPGAHAGASDGRAARAYEWTFWAAAGAVVLTGFGNLGERGGASDAVTAWGVLFAWKLALVLALLALSALRTLLVARAPPAPSRALAGTYAATAALLAVVVALAVGMAHG